MTERKRSWLEYVRWCEQPTPASFVNEAFEVDFEVRMETATQRARRRWKMVEEEGGKGDG
jgi:hypothetical protein